MADIPHDRPDQLAHVQSGLLTGEQLYCVYDDKGVGSGFIALTNFRIIILNKSFVSAFPGHKGVAATISVPYSQVSSVSTLSKTSAFGRFFSDSHIYLITAGGTHYTVELRATDRAKHVHNTILWMMTSHAVAVA